MFQKIRQFFGCLGIITLGAFLGALGGQNFKWVRRFIFPLIFVIYALYVVHNLWVATIYCMSGVLSIGYGRKDEFDDKSSFLGKIAYNLFPNNAVLQDVMLRGVIGILITISLISLPIITGKWLSYFLGSVLIIGVWAGNSWQGYGEIPVKLFGKTYNLLKVDLITYAVTSCGIILIINGWLG